MSSLLEDKVDIAESEYDADIFLFSGAIDELSYGLLVEEVTEHHAKRNCLLILVTGGGYGAVAYRIGRLLQKSYDQFYLFAPSYCKSAGTLIALGAHRLIMDQQFSELGPLDVQLPIRDELWERRSGLISRSAFKSLTEASFEMYMQMMLDIKRVSNNKITLKLASEISTGITSELMKPIYAQLNPDVIGSDFRDLNVATEYGNRLSKYSENPKEGAVRRLVSGYPSHDFIIDDEEARTLFCNVEMPKSCLYELIANFGSSAYNEQASPVVCAVRRMNEVTDEQQSEGRDVHAHNDGEKAPGLDEDRQDHRPRHTGAPEAPSARTSFNGHSETLRTED